MLEGKGVTPLFILYTKMHRSPKEVHVSSAAEHVLEPRKHNPGSVKRLSRVLETRTLRTGMDWGERSVLFWEKAGFGAKPWGLSLASAALRLGHWRQVPSSMGLDAFLVSFLTPKLLQSYEPKSPPHSAEEGV